jgi:DNA invertase Pin-like site-specific DNA recombinase
MSRIGYARVSSKDQNLDSQLDLLKAAGCERIFEDKVSGVKESRPEWDRLLEFLREGDTVVVAELSRMTRSLMHLLSLVKEFEQRGVQIVSLREHIDTSTATGRAFLSILGAINQMERELKSERAAAGRASAKARGRTGGRPRTDATSWRMLGCCIKTLINRWRRFARRSVSAGGLFSAIWQHIQVVNGELFSKQ